MDVKCIIYMECKGGLRYHQLLFDDILTLLCIPYIITHLTSITLSMIVYIKPVGSQSDGSRVFKRNFINLSFGPKLLVSNVFWNWIWTLNACSADSECRAWRLTLWDFDSAQAVLIKYTEIVTNVTYKQLKKKPVCIQTPSTPLCYTYSEPPGHVDSPGGIQNIPYLYKKLSKSRFSDPFFGRFLVISGLGSQIYIVKSAILSFWVFLSTFLHEITLKAIDIDNIGCLEPFLPLWEHFWNRVSVELNCASDLTPRLRELLVSLG